MKLTFGEQMWLNHVSSSSPIEVYICSNHFQEIVEAKWKLKENKLDWQKSDIKDVRHRDQSDVLEELVNSEDDVLFRNAIYKRILYTFNKVNFKLQENEVKMKNDIVESLKKH